MNIKTRERLQNIKKRYEEIDKSLSNLEIIKNLDLLRKFSKEKAQIEQINQLYNQYLQVEQNFLESKKIIENNEDIELVQLAKQELKNNEELLFNLENKLMQSLLSNNPNDGKNVIIEIRGAAGGNEANIFAGDLYRMYVKYAEQQNWKIEVLESKISEAGGFNQISFLIKGEKVYSKMKFEAGSHRVQRIPKTESQGRIHTSTATVAVLPEILPVDIDIKQSDLKIDTYRASGAGGQHVNTTDSAVRITHLPTNIVVTSQDGRSQHDNKDKALKVLYAKVYELELQKQQEKVGFLRKDAVGTGERSEKVRTYNYPQNRITDHRINLTLQKLDIIMEGKLDELINALIADEQQKKLEGSENI